MSPSPTNAAASPEGEGGVRLDLWLWAARFFKTRALAKKAIELGQVRIDGQTLKPSRTVRPGLVLAIERAGERYEVEVRGVADQRWPLAHGATAGHGGLGLPPVGHARPSRRCRGERRRRRCERRRRRDLCR